MKIFEKKDVYSWANAEEAKEYIGGKGYFVDSLTELENDIKNGRIFILKDIDAETALSTFKTRNFTKTLFLPADKVKEIEEPKKYRPFLNIEEFKKITYGDFCTSCIGETIQIEHKITSERYDLMIVGTFQNGLVLPLYGELNMKQLFDTFKLCLIGKWQPFGVEE